MIWNRKVAIGATVVVVLILLVYGFWPTATPVTVERVTRDSLRVTVEEEGQTRLRNQYVLSAPTTGYLRRVQGEPDDQVTQGEVVARLATLPSTVQDASGYRAAQAQAQGARAGLRRAEAEAAAARATFEHADTTYDQIQRLHRQGSASQQQLNEARTERRRAEAQHEAAQQAVEQAQQEVQAAQSRLGSASASPETLETRVTVQSPIEGRILEVQRKSAGVVQAGAPLLTVGHPDSLEVVVEVRSSDAVRITEGIPVDLVRWGGDRVLNGSVRNVTPMGKTEVSALGVEEQRVDVVVDLHSPASVQEKLGAGYRVVARFLLWEGADVLQVPRSALFRHEGGWAVFVIRDDRARLQPVQVGHRSGLQVQITDGLQAGDQVVTHPGNELSDGTRIEAR